MNPSLIKNKFQTLASTRTYFASFQIKANSHTFGSPGERANEHQQKPYLYVLHYKFRDCNVYLAILCSPVPSGASWHYLLHPAVPRCRLSWYRAQVTLNTRPVHRKSLVILSFAHLEQMFQLQNLLVKQSLNTIKYGQSVRIQHNQNCHFTTQYYQVQAFTLSQSSQAGWSTFSMIKSGHSISSTIRCS